MARLGPVVVSMMKIVQNVSFISESQKSLIGL